MQTQFGKVPPCPAELLPVSSSNSSLSQVLGLCPSPPPMTSSATTQHQVEDRASAWPQKDMAKALQTHLVPKENEEREVDERARSCAGFYTGPDLPQAHRWLLWKWQFSKLLMR